MLAFPCEERTKILHLTIIAYQLIKRVQTTENAAAIKQNWSEL